MTAAHQARRRLARTREHVTIRTRTRDTTVNASTGSHTYTDTAVLSQIPAIIHDTTDLSARDVDERRDINVKQFHVKVEASTPITLGQTVTVDDSTDDQLEGVVGTVTTVGRSGRMWRSFTMTSERTP